MFEGRIDFDKTPENIKKYVDTLGVKYHVYKKGVTKEYDYLDDNSFCITIENPYKSDEKMYLDLYNDEEEYILSYYKWHRHYGNFANSLNALFDDIKGILENRKCTVITNSTKRWLTSCLEETPCDKNYNYRKNIDELPKEFIEEIDTLGENVEFYYWNVADNFEIEVPIIK